MGMISIKYQLNWEPQPGVQCVKGKCTSHFHKACSSGKEGLRFALIIPGFGVTLVAFHQATRIGPNPQSTARSVYRACPCSLGCAHVSKGAKAAANFCGVAPGAGGESPWLCSLLGVASRLLPKCKVLLRPRPVGRSPQAPGPRGHREPLAVRLYGPPLRPAEASPGQREESRESGAIASARIPPRGYLASISLPLRAVAWCENASPGRTGAAASAARAVGGGRGGGEVRGGDGQRVVFFSFPSRAGVCKSKPKSVPWAGRTFFLVPVCRGPPGAERKQWRQRGRSPGASAIILRPSRRAQGEAGWAVSAGLGEAARGRGGGGRSRA